MSASAQSWFASGGEDVLEIHIRARFCQLAQTAPVSARNGRHHWRQPGICLNVHRRPQICEYLEHVSVLRKHGVVKGCQPAPRREVHVGTSSYEPGGGCRALLRRNAGIHGDHHQRGEVLRPLPVWVALGLQQEFNQGAVDPRGVRAVISGERCPSTSIRWAPAFRSARTQSIMVVMCLPTYAFARGHHTAKSPGLARKIARLRHATSNVMPAVTATGTGNGLSA